MTEGRHRATGKRKNDLPLAIGTSMPEGIRHGVKTFRIRRRPYPTRDTTHDLTPSPLIRSEMIGVGAKSFGCIAGARRNDHTDTICDGSFLQMQDNAPAISIIVVSYNTRDMTLECIRSVYAQTRLDFELIVLDNASTDGSAEAIRSEFPDIRVLAETENHGFAKGNNIAALQARGDYLLLLNPDTVVLDGAIDRLFDFARLTPEAGIWGGRTLYGDRSLNPASCWQRMTLWSLTSQVLGLSSIFRGSAVFNPEGYGGWQRDTEREVDIVSGCFLLIRRRFWEDLAGFDLSFVMYGEEADLCLRARQKGARPRVTPEAQIVHYAGASETVRTDKMIRLLRAKILLIRRHFPAWQRQVGLTMFRLWPFGRYWGTRAFGRRENSKTWGAIWNRRAEWWNGWPELETPAE